MTTAPADRAAAIPIIDEHSAELREFVGTMPRAEEQLAALSLPARRFMARAFRAHRVGDLDTALQGYIRVLVEQPTNPIALHYAALLGGVLNRFAKQEKKPMAADEVARLMALSVAYAPDNPAAVFNFAKFQQERGEIQDARQLYENAVRLNPYFAEAWTNLGNVWGELGDRDRMEECWELALMCPTDGSADARFNLSMLKLLRGDYVEGWRDYEARWDSASFRYGYGRRDIRRPRWDGSKVGILLLHAEQGAGDAIMMSRYIPLACERARRVIVEVVPSLTRLFASSFPDVEVRERKIGELPEYDRHLPMMSLPHLFQTTVETVPPPAQLARSLMESRSFPAERGRIGVCWKGSPNHPDDRKRSMPFEALSPLLEIEGLTFQSLQYGEAPTPLIPLEASDYLDTAAVIARCELVITVDTSIAHLAAGMHVPTWILLPFYAEWRWLQDREDSPWYKSARLFRQSRAGDWHELIQRVITELET